MRQIQHAAGTVHNVEVQILRQTFPQLERKFVEVRVGVEVVIGAYDGGVTPRIAATQPALFEHGHVAHAVFLGQVIGGGQAMAAAAYHNGVITCFGLRAAPCTLPVFMACQSVASE